MEGVADHCERGGAQSRGADDSTERAAIICPTPPVPTDLAPTIGERLQANDDDLQRIRMQQGRLPTSPRRG
jgi:hypothetical protein